MLVLCGPGTIMSSLMGSFRATVFFLVNEMDHIVSFSKKNNMFLSCQWTGQKRETYLLFLFLAPLQTMCGEQQVLGAQLPD